MIFRKIFIIFSSFGLFFDESSQIWGKNEASKKLMEENSDEFLFNSGDKSNWVDPTDMINFDFNKNQMRPSKPLPSDSTVVEVKSVSKLVQVEKPNLVEIATDENLGLKSPSQQTSPNIAQNIRPDPKSCSCHETEAIIGHFKQVIRKLLTKKMGLNLKDSFKEQVVQYDATLSLTSSQLKFLDSFINVEKSNELSAVHDAMEIIPELFEKIYKRNVPVLENGWFSNTLHQEIQNFLPILNIFGLILLFIFIISRVKIQISQAKLFLSTIFSAFLISVVWNWNYLYKIKHAELRARIHANSRDHCVKKTDSTGFFGYFAKLFKIPEPDQCLEYQKSVLIDPFWEVTPMHAITMTLADTIFSPLKLVGENFGKFYAALLKDLPFLIWWIVIPSLTFLFVLFLFFTCGYRFSFLYGLIRFEPTYHSGLVINRALRGSESGPGSPPMALSDTNLTSTNSGHLKPITRSASTSRLR